LNTSTPRKLTIALDDSETTGTPRSPTSRCCTRRSSRSTVPSSSPPQESARNDTLSRRFVSLGQKLNVTLLAEGIETRAHSSALRLLRCEFGQGYLFSPAVPADEVEALLARVPAQLGVEGRHCHHALNPSVERVRLSRSDQLTFPIQSAPTSHGHSYLGSYSKPITPQKGPRLLMRSART